MKTVNRDPVTIFRESYRARFPESLSTDPIVAFRETYAAARQQGHRTELGMTDHNDDVPDDAVDHDEREDDEHAEDAGDGLMRHACHTCGYEHHILPPRGFRLASRKRDSP